MANTPSNVGGDCRIPHFSKVSDDYFAMTKMTKKLKGDSGMEINEKLVRLLDSTANSQTIKMRRSTENIKNIKKKHLPSQIA